MYAIAAAFLMTFDMIGGEPPSFDMIGSAPVVVVKVVTQPVVQPQRIAPPSNASEPPKVKGHQYPVRGGHWSVNGDWTPSKAELIRHLMADGMHRGKFSQQYLESLSREELLSLHDDDHEFKVDAKFVQRPSQQVFQYQSSCPGGICPTNRRRRR